jgi:hypothetical protein
MVTCIWKVGIEVLKVAIMKMAVFWVVAAASTSETSVNFYQTTRQYNPEDSHYHAFGRPKRR